jgi:hypothetical protein
MTTTLGIICHQVWTDTRGLRLFLWAWGLVLLAQAAVLVVGPSDVTPGVARFPYSLDQIAIVMRVVVTVVLTALVIHRDPAVGTTAFWRTRPIAGGTMWASKVVWIGLWLVAVPGVVLAASFAALGLSLPDAARAGLMVAGDQIFVLGPALLAAAITDTLAHFVVAEIAGIALYMAAGSALQMRLRTWLPAVQVTTSSPLTLWALLMCAGGVAVLAVVYLTRRLAVAGVLMLAVLFSALVALYATRVQIPDPDPEPRPLGITMPHSDGIAIRVAPASMRSVRSTPELQISADDTRKGVMATLDVAGAPPDVLLSTLAVSSRLHVPGMADSAWQTARSAGMTGLPTATVDDQPYRAIRAALRAAELVLPYAPHGIAPVALLTAVPEETYDRFAQVDASLDATVTLRAQRLVVYARLPLEPGAIARIGRTRGTLVAVKRTTAGIEASVSRPVLRTLPWANWRSAYEVVLYNPARKQAIVLAQQYATSVAVTFALRNRAGIGITRYVFNPAPEVVQRFGIDVRWIAESELVFLWPEEIGTITRSVKVTGFKLGAPSWTQPPE